MIDQKQWRLWQKVALEQILKAFPSGNGAKWKPIPQNISDISPAFWIKLYGIAVVVLCPDIKTNQTDSWTIYFHERDLNGEVFYMVEDRNLKRAVNMSLSKLGFKMFEL